MVGPWQEAPGAGVVPGASLPASLFGATGRIMRAKIETITTAMSRVCTGSVAAVYLAL